MELKKAASHPDVPRPSNEALVQLATQVCHAIEECGASPALTRAVSLAADLATYLRKPGPAGEPPLADLEAEGRLMRFGEAIEVLKAGARVARAGWNGKGMWLAYTPGSTVAREHVRPGHALSQIAAELHEAESFRVGGHIDMRAADGSLVVGWLASQTDMLSEDWVVVEG